MSIFQTLTKMLGVPEHSAEDAIKSEQLARAVLTRRQALGGIGALVTGRAFGFGPVADVTELNISDLVDLVMPTITVHKGFLFNNTMALGIYSATRMGLDESP